MYIPKSLILRIKLILFIGEKGSIEKKNLPNSLSLRDLATHFISQDVQPGLMSKENNF